MSCLVHALLLCCVVSRRFICSLMGGDIDTTFDVSVLFPLFSSGLMFLLFVLVPIFVRVYFSSFSVKYPTAPPVADLQGGLAALPAN